MTEDVADHALSRADHIHEMPRHHVPEHQLGAYVDGRNDNAAALAIACHLTLCEACRGRVQSLEALAGAAFDSLPAVALQPGALEAVLGRLDDRRDGQRHGQRGGQRDDGLDSRPRLRLGLGLDDPSRSDESPSRRRDVVAGDGEEIDEGVGTQSSRSDLPSSLLACGLPRPLLRALPQQRPLRWRFLAPGVHFIDLAAATSAGRNCTARLLKLRQGLEIPLHGHHGPEYTVVFTGGLDEADAHYSRGDLAFRMPGERHVQHVARGQDCVALQVNEGPLEPLTLKGKLLTLLDWFSRDR